VSTDAAGEHSKTKGHRINGERHKQLQRIAKHFVKERLITAKSVTVRHLLSVKERLMVYVCCYSDEFKFFKLRKDKKKEGEREGICYTYLHPNPRFFFSSPAAPVGRERKEDKKSS
jgi:hypothetical protein